jgi:hypothetical protein
VFGTTTITTPGVSGFLTGSAYDLTVDALVWKHFDIENGEVKPHSA